MNGLFARLSARVGGLDGAPVGALRPRSRSLYEPGPSAWDAGGLELEENGLPVAVAPLPPSRQRPLPFAGDAPPIFRPPDAEAAELVPEGRGSGPVAGHHDWDAPPTRPGDEERRAQPPAAVEPRPRPPASHDVADALRSPAVSRGTPPARPVATSARPVATSARPVATSALPALDVVAAEVPGHALSVSPTVRPALPALARPRRIPETGRRQADAAPRGEPPAVHVTIGRVEVRAVPEPARAAARPERTEPAVTTLDAYLRQRARSG